VRWRDDQTVAARVVSGNIISRPDEPTGIRQRKTEGQKIKSKYVFKRVKLHKKKAGGERATGRVKKDGVGKE
jgi:hypothetical protein